MKHKRLLAIALAAVLLLAALCGCAGKSEAVYDEYADFAVAEAPAAAYAPAEPEIAMATEAAVAEEFSAEAGNLSTQSYNSEYKADPSDFASKIIYSANLSIQTTEFDTAVSLLEKNVAQIGGFVENSNVNGDVFYNNDGTTQIVNRWANYTVRVPAESFEAFLRQADGLGNVVSSGRYAENVTSTYTDYEAHLSSLKTEQERLLSMLEKATEVDNLIALEQRLSEVRYEIESIERNLRNLDRQISYSTVDITLQEVERYTPTVPVTRTFGEKLADAFSDGLSGFVSGLKAFIVWLVSALPALLVIAVIVVVVIVIVRRVKKKKAAKKAAAQEKEEAKKEEKE